MFNIDESKSSQNDLKNSIIVNYLEFQWIFFGKLVYNRIINRKEIWKLMLKSFKDKQEFFIWDIRNYCSNNKDEENEYDRVIAFNQN